jgi:hypothetical protein
METMIKALEQGWTVSEVARVLARGNNEDRGFLVTLANYHQHTLQRLYVPDSPECNDLLTYVIEKPVTQ